MRRRESYLHEPIEDIRVSSSMNIRDLISAYEKIHGFMAGHLARAVKMLRECLKSSDLRVLSFTANLIATGLRGVFSQLISSNTFNLVVTTCGSVDHDIARSGGGIYYKGFFEADDVELNDVGIHRLGNVFIPVENYGPIIEKQVYSVLDNLDRSKEWGIYEILWEIGKEITDDNSILRSAEKTKTPIIVPGYLDGAFGTALFTYTQTHKDIKINPMRDEEVMANSFFTAKKATALIIGGGISKHHSIWWAQFRGGFDCVVYLTTAVEYDGSLSGARPREAITWGKIKPNAGHVVVYGDATILLPLIAAAIVEEFKS